MTKRLVLLIAFIFTCLNSYCFDWAELHEKACKISLKDALAVYQKDASSITTQYVLALCYLDARKDKDAEAVFMKILKAEPENLGARWGIAEVLRRKHMLDEAEVDFKKIIEEHPHYVPAYLSLGYIYYIKKDFTTCISLCAQVINMDRKFVDSANLARAHCLYAGVKGMIAYFGGPISKAVNGPAVMRHLKIAQRIDADNAAVYFGFGSYYLLKEPNSSRNPDKALKYLLAAKDKAPGFADIYARIAQAYKLKGNQEKFNDYLKKAFAIDPRNEIAHDIQSGRCEFICVGNPNQ